jgi:hypothetical protein
MKNLKGISVAALTFFAGVAIYFVFLNFAVDKTKHLVEMGKYSSLPVLSLCEVTRNYEFFGNENFRVRVYLTGRDNWFYKVFDAKENCAHDDARVEFWLEEETKAETETLFQELTARYSEGSITFAEVEMVGELIDHDQYGFRPFTTRFSIKAKEIKQISPVKQISLAEWHNQANRHNQDETALSEKALR